MSKMSREQLRKLVIEQIQSETLVKEGALRTAPQVAMGMSWGDEVHRGTNTGTLNVIMNMYDSIVQLEREVQQLKEGRGGLTPAQQEQLWQDVEALKV